MSRPTASNKKRGRLLLAAPCLPAGDAGRPIARLLRELSVHWETHPAWAPPAGDDAAAADRLLEELKRLISAAEYAAVLAVEHPAVTGCLTRLKLFTSVPIVYLRAAQRAAEANRLRPFARLAAREEAAKAEACAAEVWTLERRGDDRAWAREAKPARLEHPWLDRRLWALARPARPRAAGLASIVIPCFNKVQYTRECIEAVVRNTRGPYELIVVDNGSTDGTAAFVRSRTKARLLRNRRNLGFARAINQGLRAARGRYFVWLNNDVVVTPGWLERMVACAERSSRIGAVGPCTNDTVGFQKIAAAYPGIKKLGPFSQAWSLQHRGRAMEVHRLVGFCLLVKADAARRVGLLDERFSPACYEDYDYCLRLRQAGFELACALDVFVHHHGHKTFGGEAGMRRQAGLSREVFLDKWCNRALEFLDELDAVAAETNAGGKRGRRPPGRGRRPPGRGRRPPGRGRRPPGRGRRP